MLLITNTGVPNSEHYKTVLNNSNFHNPNQLSLQCTNYVIKVKGYVDDPVNTLTSTSYFYYMRKKHINNHRSTKENIPILQV